MSCVHCLSNSLPFRIPGAVVKKLQVVIVDDLELQTVTSYNVTRSQNELQHVQLQVTTGKTGKNSSKT